MIIVTGGAGFIGSNIIKGLNDQGFVDILAVDDLTDGRKFKNIVDLAITDYMDKDDFINSILSNDDFGPIEGIFHQGACSATTEWDGKFLMRNNYEYSKELLHFAIDRHIPFLYASSAAVYGGRSENFREDREFEKPLNMYGYSKYLFDQYVRELAPKSMVCGFRYFNVYGPRESHKENMASVAYHLHAEILKGENPKLFEGSDQFLRDFVYVDDVVKVNLWFWKQRISGIFNCGSGRAESFQAVADAVINHYKKGSVQSIPFPDTLKGRYQTFTQADLTLLRKAGCDIEFKTVAQGVEAYMKWLDAHPDF